MNELMIQGYSSEIPVKIVSKPPKRVSKPSMSNMIKKRILKNTEPFIVARPSGYTMKARPGPLVTTCEMSVPLM